jgi:hypothetical protein
MKSGFEILSTFIHFDSKTKKNTRFIIDQLIELIQILIFFLIISHYIACIWIFVGKNSSSEPFLDKNGDIFANTWILNGHYNYNSNF